MAMLAEPRRKQKVSLNPRGTNWSNDNSKFGQRMLEKMGWTKGRGLGAKEHGQTEHVKVTLKSDKRGKKESMLASVNEKEIGTLKRIQWNQTWLPYVDQLNKKKWAHLKDTKVSFQEYSEKKDCHVRIGVGCSRNFADKWIEHQNDFNTLLAALNQDHCQADDDKMDSSITQVSSLEAKSKLSRSRVHYQKFAKGKDLSSKSLHDLACVFGQRKRKSEPNTPQNKSEAEENGKNYQGVLTVKSEDSVQEYFAKKMAALQKNKYGIEPSDDQDNNRGSPKSENMEDKSKADQLSDKLKKKSKSKKKSAVTFSIGNEEINTKEETRIKENAVTVSLSNEETKSRSKKSKKRKYLEKMEKLEGNVIDASLSIECDSVSEPKKSKKKDESDQEGGGKDEIVIKSDNSLNTGHETSLKFEDDPSNSDSTSKVSSHFSAKSRHKKSKKRKHSKKSAGSHQEETHVDEDPLPSTEAEPVLEPKKSKKKKCKSENIEMRTKEEAKVDTLEGNKEDKEKEIIKSKSSKKSKKKKEETHVEHKEVENVTVDVTDDIEIKKEDCEKKSLIENPHEERCKDDRNERAVNNNKQKDEGRGSKNEKTATFHLPTGISLKRLNFPHVYEVKKAFTGSNVDQIIGYADHQFRHESTIVIRSINRELKAKNLVL